MSFDQDPNEQANISGADFAIMCDEIAALKQQNAELLKDAKKYRLLRDEWFYCGNYDAQIRQAVCPEELDSVLDAAIASAEEK